MSNVEQARLRPKENKWLGEAMRLVIRPKIEEDDFNDLLKKLDEGGAQ